MKNVTIPCLAGRVVLYNLLQRNGLPETSRACREAANSRLRERRTALALLPPSVATDSEATSRHKGERWLTREEVGGRDSGRRAQSRCEGRRCRSAARPKLPPKKRQPSAAAAAEKPAAPAAKKPAAGGGTTERRRNDGDGARREAGGAAPRRSQKKSRPRSQLRRLPKPRRRRKKRAARRPSRSIRKAFSPPRARARSPAR